MSHFRRRTVLAATTATTALGVPVPAGARREPDRFRHGVASGDPLPTAVVIWTRVTTRSRRIEVGWEVATDRAFADVVRRGRFTTGPDRDHTVKVDVTGLAPGRWYFYRFSHAGERSRVGRTRTAPAPDVADPRLRLGVVSCSNYQAGYFAAYRHLAARDDLDGVLHLGDYLYESGAGDGAVREHRPAHEIVSLADYRERHAQHKADPDLQDLHARAPFIVTWDDHEVTNDSWKDGAENHQPDTEGDYRRRRARAHRAYDEWMPVRLDGTADLRDGTRLYRRLRWGSLAEISMLDLRTYRDEMVTTAAPFPLPQVQAEADDPDRTLTGRQQMRWLKESVVRDTARWKLIGNSVMIAPLSLAQLPRASADVVKQVTGEDRGDGIPFNTDQWDGYTADRRELFAHLAEHEVSDTVFLTGDIHSAWACDLPLDPGSYPLGGTAGVEFVCTSVTSDNIDDITGAPPRTATLAVEAGLLASNRHIKYVNFDDHGYSVLDVTPERAQMDYWVVEDKTERDTGVRHEASWFTAAGSGVVTATDHPVEGTAP